MHLWLFFSNQHLSVLRILILKLSSIFSSNNFPPKGMFGSADVAVSWFILAVGVNLISAKSCTVFFI